ncbi:MAG: RluA family pseudouridine synthase [Coriobacteriia bacterium]|nr:RluA family pseudouridine synthase [Coriobacteriia bacterium]
MRLDAFLAQVEAYSSRSIAATFCDNQKVLVNGVFKPKSYKLADGDEVEWEPAVEDVEVEGEDIPLDVRYEDDDIIVVSKQPGLVCHPAHGHPNGTLVNALINHCGKKHLCDIQDDHRRLGIVHRLDADTSGLMVCAKNNASGRELTKAMKAHETLRCYKALVYGNIKQDSGKIDVPLLRTLNKRPKMIASNDAKAKNATTTFKVIERIESELGNFSLLECKLETGRTHQIRAHMEYIRHPVVGDPLYTGGAPKDFDAASELGLTRQFLHSYKIGFKHPRSGQYLEFKDDLPFDLQKVLKLLGAN